MEVFYLISRRPLCLSSLSVCVSICLSVCPYFALSLSLPPPPPPPPPPLLSVSDWSHSFFGIFVSLCICVSVYLSVCLYFALSTFLIEVILFHPLSISFYTSLYAYVCVCFPVYLYLCLPNVHNVFFCLSLSAFLFLDW